MNQNPLLELRELGQSIWLDFIRKGMFTSGEFQSFISKDGVLGVTSNPSIFEKAIVGSHDYDEAIHASALEGKTAEEIYQRLTILDIQKAADLFHPTFEKTKGGDGFVSLEVSPHLAHDTEGTMIEARKLWKDVSRPNVLIKVPGTTEGIPAIKQLIGEGININITLLFSLDRYEEIAEAYISGLESRLRDGKSLTGIASVASFFLSRIDVAVDPLLPAQSALRGQTAIASAKIAYQKYKSIFTSERFQKLKIHGAKTQRLLWASTSTKNPSDSDVKYVEALIGPETVNTLPLETLAAYRDHGDPANRLETGLTEATQHLKRLGEMKIDLKKVTKLLEDEGVQKFNLAFDKLMDALKTKRKTDLGDQNLIPRLTNCGDTIQKRITQLDKENYCRRVWQKDAALWKSDATTQEMIKKSLGWLHIAEKMKEALSDTNAFVQEVQKAGFKHVLHMGMGGSSLAPLVFARTFSSKNGLPLTVLDTTDPETIKKIEESIPLEKTLFIVASKSGTTAEPLAFKDYFYERVKLIKGEKAGENFVAITDPNTPLVRMAKDQKFRRIFLSPSDIGGRYSALTYFGLIPAALMGVNVGEILERAIQSAHSSASCISGKSSPAFVLGAALGEMAQQKRNKITLIVDKPLEALGLWLEQLMAESTGKEGTGLIPIANEPLGPPVVYGEDRLFVYLTVGDTQKNFLSALKEAGQPIVSIEMSDKFDLGQEFFQWEFATALAGSILGINAFDQPNVQESKDITNKLLVRPHDKMADDKPIFTAGALSFYSYEDLNQFLKKAVPGDYIALMAFLTESPATTEILQGIRKKFRDKLKLATTLGYGPRFLHSTGQLHKGGPNTGLFLQLTADDRLDVSIPEKPYTFGAFKQAQAQGDLETLHKHQRRAMRIHLGKDVEKGLRELDAIVNVTLESM